MRRLKRLLSGLLLWCMVVTMLSIPATTANAMPPKSGECGVHGDNVIWILDDTDTLTISGTGAMKEYSDITDPQQHYTHWGCCICWLQSEKLDNT